MARRATVHEDGRARTPPSARQARRLRSRRSSPAAFRRSLAVSDPARDEQRLDVIVLVELGLKPRAAVLAEDVGPLHPGFGRDPAQLVRGPVSLPMSTGAAPPVRAAVLKGV